MKLNKLAKHILLFPGSIMIAVLAVLGFRVSGQDIALAQTGHEGHDHGAHAGDDDHEGHDHGARHGGHKHAAHAEDDDILAVQCEHDIPAAECDQCRFELGVVKVDAELLKQLVRTGKVAYAEWAVSVAATGEIEADPARTVCITPLLNGRIVGIKKFTGETVDKDEVIASLFSPELGEAKTDYKAALAALTFAEPTLEREKVLYEKNISSEDEYLKAKTDKDKAQAHLAGARNRLITAGLSLDEIRKLSSQTSDEEFPRIDLHAPRSGIILARNVSEGEHTDGSRSLFTISDLSSLWMWADIYEKDLKKVYKGLAEKKNLEVKVFAPVLSGEEFSGTLELLGGEVDRHTRTIKARIRIKNSELLLRPGMFAHCRILIPDHKKTLSVPREAVQTDEGESFVFLFLKDDLWVRRDVSVGRKSDDRIEILDGLVSGDSVITQGAFMLKSDVLREKMGAG